MMVNEKCDIYSFGVVTLEILMGTHPGDLLSYVSSLSSSSAFSVDNQTILLKDVIDQRLPPPQNKVADGVIHIAKLAFGCLNADPQYRPSMRQVSSLLAAKWDPLTKPISEIQLKEILVHNVRTC